MPLCYTIHSREDGSATVAAYHNGEQHIADNTHINFDAIVKGALDVDTAIQNGEHYTAEQLSDAVARLFDVTPQIAEKFENITERVSVKAGRVYFDGDEIHDACSEQLLRFLDAGDEVQWIALANFYEKLASNPNEHSREQLYTWLKRFEFTITLDGDIVCYKGVRDDLTSYTAGPGIVNGEPKDGYLDNTPGNVIEMARSTVQHDPSVGCSKGLHVASYTYGHSFGSKTVIVLVNPRDVVSVPTECGWEKMRVCRYTVKEVVESRYERPLYYGPDDEDDYAEEPCCPVCGESGYVGEDECSVCEDEREAECIEQEEQDDYCDVYGALYGECYH